MPVIKFRPSLSLNEIQHIIASLGDGSPQSTAIIASLNKMVLKAKHGIITPSHATTTPEESLGFTESIHTLLDIWQSNPTLLTQSQLLVVQHHRYTHDMMTPQEEKEYES